MEEMFSSFTFIKLNVNGGAGKARNEGLKVAQGKWLVFADADDYFTPHAFDYFLEHYDSMADIIFFKAEGWDMIQEVPATGRVWRNRFIDNFLEKKKNAEDDLRYRWHCPWGKMIRRTLIIDNSICFDETKYSNDVMFSIIAGNKASMLEVDDRVAYCVTTSSNSLTQTVTYESIMCRYGVLIRCNQYLKMVGESKNQAVVLRFFIVALKSKPKCILPMLKILIKEKADFFAGFRKWREIFRRR